MDNIIFVKKDLFEEVYADRATVLDKSADNDADFNMYDQPDEYWISGAGKDTAWLINFRFLENIIYPDDSLVNIFVGNTVIKDKSVRNFEGFCSIDFSPIPDQDNEGETLSQYALLKEIIETKLPVYFEPANGAVQRHITPAAGAKFRQEDIDFNIFEEATY